MGDVNSCRIAVLGAAIVVVAGSLPVLVSDYGIEAPNVAGIIAVQDNGTMEFRVVLARG
jgi:hypothetical protein